MWRWLVPKSLTSQAWFLLESALMGIRSKKIVNLDALNSMIEQQVKKEIWRKGKEADIHMIDKAPEGLRGVIPAYTARNAWPYQQ